MIFQIKAGLAHNDDIAEKQPEQKSQDRAQKDDDAGADPVVEQKLIQGVENAKGKGVGLGHIVKELSQDTTGGVLIQKGLVALHLAAVEKLVDNL